MQANHLVIVPGHGIWKHQGDGSSSDDWYLESFQIEGNDHLFFIRHIEDAMKALTDDSILVFSGGQTKLKAGPMSEAQSYYYLAEKLALIQDSFRDRVHTEEYARDSFENLLFSIARFKEICGNYPERITITGFEFKRRRFLELHLKALKFPVEKVEYIGCDPQPNYSQSDPKWETYYKDLEMAEDKNAIQKFLVDPLGNGPVLGKKKASRNPFNRSHSYAQTCPELEVFFTDTADLSDIQTPW